MKGLIDIHCHILPGVDDGAKSLSESIEMLQLEYEEGVRMIIATPHYRPRMFECSMETIQQQYLQVKDAAKNVGEGMEVFLGCEHHAYIEMTDDLLEKQRVTMAESDYVLTEFSEYSEFRFIRERIYDLLSNGFEPIIAHAERYKCLVENVKLIPELIQMGAFIQVNAGSITGDDGRKVKSFCKKLMKNDFLHFIGTDGHDVKERPPHMAACAAYMEKKMGAEYTRRILVENPSRILNSKQT